MNLVPREQTQRWVKPTLGAVVLFGVGCAMAWPGRNAGSEGVFHLPYVTELFGGALIAAAFGQRWRWPVAVVVILTSAQALVYLVAYPSDPLVSLGIGVASGIISGGAVTGAFFGRIWRALHRKPQVSNQ